MVSSNHKVLPLGKHKKGIGNPGNREFGETLGNRQLQAIGNLRQSGMCGQCGNTQGNRGIRECTGNVGNTGIYRESGNWGN